MQYHNNQPEWNQTANHFFQIKFMAAYGQQMNGSKIEGGSLGQQHFVFFEWIGLALHFRAHPPVSLSHLDSQVTIFTHAGFGVS